MEHQQTFRIFLFSERGRADACELGCNNGTLGILTVTSTCVCQLQVRSRYANVFQGGHFAAVEAPDLLLKDLEDFIAVAWPHLEVEA